MLEREVKLTSETSGKTIEQKKWLKGLRNTAKSYQNSGLDLFHISLSETRSLFEAFGLPISKEMSKILTSPDGYLTLNSESISRIRKLEDARNIAMGSWALLSAAISKSPEKTEKN